MPAVRRARGAASAAKPVPPLPFAAGDGRPRGKGPKKGAPNAGRPPGWFKQQIEAGLTRAETVDAVHAVLADATHQHFPTVLRWATEYVYGKPTQPLEHSGAIAGVVVVPATMAADQWAAAAATQQAALAGRVTQAAQAAERAAGTGR